MRCRECRWHHALKPAHDNAEWKNCMALPYPTCTFEMTHQDAECMVPDQFQALPEHAVPRAAEASRVVLMDDTSK